MIKIEMGTTPSNEEWIFAVNAMRNPMNSWEKSDCVIDEYGEFCVGSDDLNLMKKLFAAGTEHRKFMRNLTVGLEIIAPLYWWKEFDTYKVGTVCNSCSTMHKITEKEFTIDDFSHEHLIDICLVERVIDELNIYRNIYNNYVTQSDEYKTEFTKKDIWWQMIQLLPSSYNQKRSVVLNYETLVNICRQRRNHKLDEWRYFCEFAAQNVPLLKEITGNILVKNE